MSEENKIAGPDFANGVPIADLPEGGMVLGQVAGEAVLLARSVGELFAIGAECTHYHGPLAEGALVADTVRCPWHHACFSLRTGEALRAPALNPVTCWRVEQRDGTIYVREKLEPAVRPARTAAQAGPESIVIIGGGAAGNAAAEILRREGYAGRVTMLTADEAGPYDRPNLSKDYLAGTALEEWIPLRSPEFHAELGIRLKLGARREMRRKGYQLTRYADDWVVTCASAVEARAALEAASRVLKELGVTINPQKTRIHVRHGFEFLGYKIKRGSRPMNLPTSKIKTSARRESLYAYPREKSINHFKEQIRRLTRRCAPVTTRELIQQVNPVVRGWGHHYKRAQVRKLFHRLDGWLVRRIWSHRHHKWRC